MNNEENQLDLSLDRPEGDIVTLEELIGIKAEETEKKEEPLEGRKEEIEVEEEDDKKKEDVDFEDIKSVDELEEEEEQYHNTATDYRSFVDKMVAAGEWEAFDTIETESGEIKLEDVEITEELFEEILSAQKTLKEDKAREKGVEGVSDFTKRLIEIEKNGGSVRDALTAYENVKEPLSQIDTNTIEGQKAVVYMQLKSQGQEDENINLLIESYETKGILEQKAQTAESLLNEAYDEYISSINTAAIERKKAQEEALKNYKKDVSKGISDTFELTPALKNKLVDLASKPDKDGRYELDDIYNQLRKNPEKAAKLALFLYNEEEYIKQVTNKEKVKQNLDTYKKLKLVKRGNSSTNINNRKTDKNTDYIDLDKLN